MSGLTPAREQRRLLSWLPPSAATYIYTVFLKRRPLRALTHAIVKQIIPEKIKIHGVELLLNQKDAIVSGSLALGCYETALLSHFEASLKPGMCVIDIGANIGLYTIIAANTVGPDGLVVAIEPEARNCKFVERSLLLNQFNNALVFQKAVGNANHWISLFLCEDNMADHRVYDPAGIRAATPVEMIRLDDLLADKVRRTVDIIKMDVQGAEAMAFEGMRETLRENKKIKIFMEFWPWGLQKAGSTPSELLRQIRSEGFSIYQFSDRTNDFKKVTNENELCSLVQERQHANLLLERE